MEAAWVAESPPRDETNEVLDYINNLNQDMEMASSQETTPVSSQESQGRLANQGTAPVSSQEMSMSQDTASMPSQESATNATILNDASSVPMKDETCLEGLTLKCSLEE